MLTGIQNFLQFINDNWTAIIIIIALGFSIALKIKNLFTKDKNGQIEIAKAQIKQIVLKLITDAEVDYSDWAKAGNIKRAQVIQKIYADYPILAKVTDQETLIAWIDTEINNSLKELRKIVAENATEKATEKEETENA
jgi:hypothetical protein